MEVQRSHRSSVLQAWAIASMGRSTLKQNCYDQSSVVLHDDAGTNVNLFLELVVEHMEAIGFLRHDGDGEVDGINAALNLEGIEGTPHQ